MTPLSLSKADSIPGWMTKTELRWLASKAKRATVTVEAGCWKGRSTRVLADNTKGKVYAVDPWGGDYLNEDGTLNEIRTNVFDIFQSNLSDHIKSGKVIPIQSTFVDSVSKITDTPDFIFIDGDHRYQTVLADIAAAKSILKPKGILAGHDFGHPDWPGVEQAARELIPKFEVRDSIWWTTI